MITTEDKNIFSFKNYNKMIDNFIEHVLWWINIRDLGSATFGESLTLSSVAQNVDTSEKSALKVMEAVYIGKASE